MMKAVSILMLVSLALGAAHAGEKERIANEPEALQLTGNLMVDLFGQHAFKPALGELQAEQRGTVSEKSPWLAAGLSLLVPGAGEFYAESYWKAAAFFAIEVAAWTIAYSFDKKGDRKTDFFQNFADEHWSVVEYGRHAADKFFAGNAPYGWLVSNDESLPPWQRVDWDELNRMERAIASTAEGRYYSHTLPRRPEQQYYELIGKYPQYNQGWSDRPPDYNFGDPVTSLFLYYSAERGKANDYYSTAKTFVTVAFLNHILSAADAAWSASTFNNVRAEMSMQSVPVGQQYVAIPVVKLRYSF
jgi:hypothetical protein